MAIKPSASAGKDTLHQSALAAYKMDIPQAKQKPSVISYLL
jgi:hypothetical protein